MHYSVLVIGDNPEEQLAPYYEGLENFFIDHSDGEAEMRDDYEGEKHNYDSFEDFLMKEHGYVIIDGIVGRYGCENPRWDYYTLGGRWSGFFKKKGNRKKLVNQLKWGDVDSDGMYAENVKKAEQEYDKVSSACGGVIPKIEYRWEDLMSNKQFNHAQVRFIYDKQENIALFNEKIRASEELAGKYISVDDFQVSREEYIDQKKKSTFSTYAIVVNGEWIEKEDKDMNQASWDAYIAETLEGLDPNTLVSLYDCHC